MRKIETVEALHGIYKQAGGRAVQKQLDYLDSHCRNYGDTVLISIDISTVSP